jgi:hypothetical protein
LLIGLIGTSGLRNAIEQRRATSQQLRSLRSQRAELRRQLDYGPDLSTNQLGFAVRGRF